MAEKVLQDNDDRIGLIWKYDDGQDPNSLESIDEKGDPVNKPSSMEVEHDVQQTGRTEQVISRTTGVNKPGSSTDQEWKMLLKEST